VAVYSTADKEGLWVNLADEAVCIGGPVAKDSYLNIDAVLSAAVVSGAEAIHPGYGFLSENAEFARKCAANNVEFIGPSPEVIEKMGDKSVARQIMKAAGVPVIPGCDAVKDLADGLAKAKQLGFPVLIKARSGGGGKGIRAAADEKEFEKAYNLAVSEAVANFGDGSVYLEKSMSDVKHIEMQIIGDKFGNIVCMGERDCSMQLRNQKLIEEAPANIPDTARNAMIRASVAAGKFVKYVGVGTIEYLYDPGKKAFFFMEMNTRLQVEHPVTEFVTQRDLVKWQIRVAAGCKLGFTQGVAKTHGHAIECRINNEVANPDNKISVLHIANGPWVRFDSAIYGNYQIPPFYDSMIGKLVVWSTERDKAIRKMKAALCELIIDGVATNIDFQYDLLCSQGFADTTYTTKFVDRFLAGRDKENKK